MSGLKESVASSQDTRDLKLKILEDLERQKRQFKASASLPNPSPNKISYASGSIQNITGGWNQSNHIDHLNLIPKDSTTPKENSEVDFETITNKNNSPATQLLEDSKKQAFEQAVKSSFGYFIYQDSAFGNSILPVIPRISPIEVKPNPPIIDLD